MLKLLEKMHLFYIIFILVIVVILFLFNTFNVKQSPFEIHVISPLEKAFEHRLFDIDPFLYVSSPTNCSEDISILIIVTSYVANVETRSAMRRSHFNDDLREMGYRRVFLLGQIPLNERQITQNAIDSENRRFGDIVQGNFLEAYRNLTYKHLMGLKWASEKCSNVKYVVKMDDDIVLNMRRFERYMETFELPKNTIAGYVFNGLKAIRLKANKWYVTEDEYGNNIYPTFVSGWFYVTTPKICSKLVLLSYYHKYFWIDDVFVTGILGEDIRIKHYNINKLFAVHTELLDCCMNDVKRKRFECDLLVGPNGGDNNLFYRFNNVMKMCEGNKCEKRIIPLNQTCIVEKKENLLNGGRAIIENYNLI